MIVAEYPRSGGTWLCYLLSYSLNVPMTDLDQDRLVPGDPLRRALVSGRWDHRTFSRFERTAKTHQDIREVGKQDETSILLVRDGRDVMVSYFLYSENISGKKSILYKLNRVVKGESSVFLSFLRDNIKDWVRYTKKNVNDCDEVLRYEDLLNDDVGCMLSMFEKLDVQVEREIVEEAAELFSFENMTRGRSRGEENRSSFFRKGKSKDWENWFDERHLSVFEEAGGFDALQQAGYEVANR